MEGFRLDFTLPVTFTLELPDNKRAAYNSPKEVAKEKRKHLTSLDPYDPETKITRASLLGDIKSELKKHLIYIAQDQPLTASDVLEYIRDGFLLTKDLHRIYPSGYSTMIEDLRYFVHECTLAPGADSLKLAYEISSYLEQHIQTIRNPDEKGRALWFRQKACRDLADLAITVSMDINASRSFFQMAHQYDSQVITPTGGKADPITLAEYLEQAPQEGWWNPTVDEHRPHQLTEIVDLYESERGDEYSEGIDLDQDMSEAEQDQLLDDAIEATDKEIYDWLLSDLDEMIKEERTANKEYIARTAKRLEISEAEAEKKMAKTVKELEEKLAKTDRKREEETSFITALREKMGAASIGAKDAIAKLHRIRVAL